MIIIIICGENPMTTDTVMESKVNEEQSKIIYSGTYTITNSKGEHRTFRIKRQKKDAKFAPGARILSLMIGSDNENSYKGFAFVQEDKIHIWKSCSNKVNDYYAKLMKAAIDAIQASESENVETRFICSGHQYAVMLSKRCVRCNRKLTNPESIKAGIGPECATKDF